jgi:hypothetical protein
VGSYAKVEGFDKSVWFQAQPFLPLKAKQTRLKSFTNKAKQKKKISKEAFNKSTLSL